VPVPPFFFKYNHRFAQKMSSQTPSPKLGERVCRSPRWRPRPPICRTAPSARGGPFVGPLFSRLRGGKWRNWLGLSPL
jgi:hypothetical protein